MTSELDRRELRKFGDKLYKKIEHERFSMKKLLHIFEYSCICEDLARN